MTAVDLMVPDHSVLPPRRAVAGAAGRHVLLRYYLMNTRSRVPALALAVLLLDACAEHQAPTEAAALGSVVPQSIAQSAAGDPTAIPAATPTRIEFLGTTRASRRTLAVPLGAPPVDIDAFLETVRAGVAREKRALSGGTADPRAAEIINSADRFLNVRTPAELRAALGPVRDSVEETRSTRFLGLGLVDHTSAYRVGDREVLRVTTRARAVDLSPSLDCINDPVALEDGSCTDVTSFDPSQIAADVAAMQTQVDAMSADITALEYASGYVSAPGECEAERAAFIGAILGYAWWAAEAMVYAWRRDIVNAYRAWRTASMTYAGVQYAYTKYRDCLRTRTTRTRL